MNFVLAVQRDTLRGPLRRDFSFEKWRSEHERLKEDDADTNLAHAGELIHSKASAIRQSLRFTTSNDADHTTKLRSLVAMANHDALVVMVRTREKLEQSRAGKGTPINADLRVSLQLPGGGAHSPDEVLQSSVDGLELTVRTILHLTPIRWGAAKFSAVNWDNVALDLNLGIQYHYVENLWDECLWNGFQAHEVKNAVVFRPTVIERQKCLIASQWRYDHLGLQSLLNLSNELRALPFEMLSETLGFRRVSRVEKRGRKQVFRFAPPPATKDAVLDLLCPHVHAAESYYEPLLRQALEQLGGTSIEQLTKIWATIGTVARLARDKVDFNKYAGQDAHVWASEFAPVIRIDSLAECVRQSTGVSPAVAKATIEFLTYRGRAGQQLWSQPLVPIGNETVTLVIGALISPNLGRLIDLWLRQAGVELSSRGPAFEDSVRKEVQHWIQRSPAASDSAALERAFVFRPPGSRKEEIDVVWRMGKGVFVAEVKCILHPCDAKELATYYQTVVEAAAQISRKCDAIRRAPEAFRTQLRAVGLLVPKDFELLPLVILNRAIYAGFPVDGIPISDMYIVRTFMSGEYTNLALRNEHGSFEKVDTRKLYAGPGDVLSAATTYFFSPPQLEGVTAGITPRLTPAPRVNEHDWAGIHLSFQTKPETNRFKSQLDDWLAKSRAIKPGEPK